MVRTPIALSAQQAGVLASSSLSLMDLSARRALGPSFGIETPIPQSRLVAAMSDDLDGEPGSSIVIDPVLMRNLAEEHGDQDMIDLLDRLDELNKRVFGITSEQLKALQSGDHKKAEEMRDTALDLSISWNRLMRDIYNLSRKKGY